ncbi:uncharacterized protein LOC142231499 [Haematobia irritans]|uniref:uncharacterized protein LOC142231499 n=1 Tax=Haematobia irritans TaxID=7368 RepID=UPI003F5057FA
MTSSQFNFMKTKINLNPQILSKNTSEIVNTCIEKLYKEIPNKFRNSLQQYKMASNRKENQGPLRLLKQDQEILRKHQQANAGQISPKKNSPSNGDEVLLLKTIMNTSRRRLLAPNYGGDKRKLLKSPTYKIYDKRRFGSSASSSSGSILKRQDSKEKQKAYQIFSSHGLRQLKKSYTMIHGGIKKSPQGSLCSPAVCRVVQAKRSRHKLKGCVANSTPTIKGLHGNCGISKGFRQADAVLKKPRNYSKEVEKLNPIIHSQILEFPNLSHLTHCRNEQIVAQRILGEQSKKLQMNVTHRSFFKEVNRPLPAQPTTSLKGSLKRPKYIGPIFTPKEPVKKTTISPNEKLVYIKRKPLKDLNRPEVPEFWKLYQINDLGQNTRYTSTESGQYAMNTNNSLTFPTSLTNGKGYNANYCQSKIYPC